MTLERDREIAEAATPGPWTDLGDGGVWATKDHPPTLVLTQPSAREYVATRDTRFAAHFSPDRILKLLDRLQAADAAINFALGGLAEAESQLVLKGCWCPGAGDEQCTLCIVREVQRRLAPLEAYEQEDR